MKTLLLASRKGGTGKTTLAAHLAVEAGSSVLADLDQQGSLSGWWNRRGEDAPAFLNVRAGKLAEQLEALKQRGYGLCIVDTPAGSVPADDVLALADLVAVPCRPSALDIQVAREVAQACERVGRRFVYVLNQAPAHLRLTREAAELLEPLAPPVGLRVVFAEAMAGGDVAEELAPGSPAALEIRRLWKYLRRKLRNG